ncbi:MAG: RidA family protein, partial [Pseudomonadota bacterium]
PFEERVGYARAVVMSGAGGDWCFVAGTTGYDYARMAMPDDPAEQARNTLATIATTLEEAGFALGDVVRARYYLTDRAHRAAIEPVLGATFRPILPAATMVICDLAAPEMKVEIEVDAYRPA